MRLAVMVVTLTWCSVAYAECGSDLKPVPFSDQYRQIAEWICIPGKFVDGSDESTTEIELRQEATVATERGLHRDFSIDAKVTLPRISNRLSLMFKSEKTRGDEGPVDEIERDSRDSAFAAALKWAAATSDRYNIDYEIDVNPRLEVDTEIKYSRWDKLGGGWRGNHTEELYWSEDTGTGLFSSYETVKQVGPRRFYIVNAIDVSEEIKDEGLSFTKAVAIGFVERTSDTTIIDYSLRANGDRRVGPFVKNYIASAALKTEVMNKTAYYEITPHVQWVSPQYTTDIGVTFAFGIIVK